MEKGHKKNKKHADEMMSVQDARLANADLPRNAEGEIDWDIVPVARRVQLGAIACNRIKDAEGKTIGIMMPILPG